MPGFVQILHFHCGDSYVIPRFTMTVDFSCLKKIKNRFVFRILGCILETFPILWAKIEKSSEDVGSTLGQLRNSLEEFGNLRFFMLRG